MKLRQCLILVMVVGITMAATIALTKPYTNYKLQIERDAALQERDRAQSLLKQVIQRVNAKNSVSPPSTPP